MVEAAQLAYTDSLGNENPLDIGASYDVTTIPISGVQPEKGTFILLEDGNVILKNVQFGNYICNGIGTSQSCRKKID